MSERIYLLPEEGNLYKTNLHCHTTVSDGKFTPAEIKKMYMEKGYHAVAFTDHRACVPHPELTDDGFVALTGIERAFGIGKNTSVHICGISRDPDFQWKISDEQMNDAEAINEGIRGMNENNFITTLNHPRWSGMLGEDIAAVGDVANMEVVNGYEMIIDGYGDDSACYETELRRGRIARPLATDDCHKKRGEGQCGFEYFRGFTVLKAKELTYDALINSLDTGTFYASTGPMIHNLWLEDGVLHIECSPVCAVYVHGHLYKHRVSEIRDDDSIEVLDINVEKICADSRYLFLQIVNTKGERVWMSPYWQV